MVAPTSTLGDINPLRQGAFGTFANFAKEKPHSAAKASYVFIECLEQANLIPEGYEDQFSNAHDALYLAKLSKGKFFHKNLWKELPLIPVIAT